MSSDLPINPETVWLGSDRPVVLEKVFGPFIFADLRITADVGREAWIVERQSRDGWYEVCEIPAQVAEDFDNDE